MSITIPMPSGNVRENLEAQAETQGRPAEALWVEAAAKSDETT